MDTNGQLRVLEAMDRLSAGLPVTVLAELPLHWPVSAALLADPDGVVSSREDLLVEVLNSAPQATIQSPVVQAIIDAEFAGMTDIERTDVLESELLGPILRDRLATKSLETYLNGGWAKGDDPPRFVNDSSAVRELFAVALPRALLQAEWTAGASDDAVLAAARLLSFVTVHLGLDGQDPALERAKTAIRRALETVSLDEASIRRLHSDLWPTSVQTSIAAGPPDVASHPKSAPDVPESTSDPEPVSNPAVEDPPVSGKPTESLAGGGWRTLDPDMVAALAELRREARGNSARGAAIDDALLVAAGLRAVPLRGVPHGLTGQRRLAESLLHGPVPELRDAAIGWLVAYWALTDIHRMPIEGTPLTFVAAVKDNDRVALDALARFFLEVPDDLMARALYLVLMRDVHNTGGKIFSIGIPGSLRLGRKACLEAWTRMPEERRQRVLGLAADDLERLRLEFPQVASRLNEFMQHVELVPARPERTGRRRKG
jgi:hypothetical protein